MATFFSLKFGPDTSLEALFGPRECNLCFTSPRGSRQPDLWLHFSYLSTIFIKFQWHVFEHKFLLNPFCTNHCTSYSL